MKIDTFIAKTNELDHLPMESVDLKKYFTCIHDDNAFNVLNRVLKDNKGVFLNVVISINNSQILSFLDWDDSDLMWPAILTMTLEFLEDGSQGSTEHFSNGLELKLNLLPPVKKKKVLLSVKRNSALYELGVNLPLEQETRGIIDLSTLMYNVISAAEDYFVFRDKDTISHNLSDAKSRLKEIKDKANDNS